jgi:hypothetical protein
MSFAKKYLDFLSFIRKTHDFIVIFDQILVSKGIQVPVPGRVPAVEEHCSNGLKKVD